MRAIDSEALITKIMNEMRRYNYDETKILTLASVIKMVDDLPTVDVVEREKGHWISAAEFEECSACHGTHLKEFQTAYGKAQWIKSNFCPNCGADMREKGEGRRMTLVLKNSVTEEESIGWWENGKETGK